MTLNLIVWSVSTYNVQSSLQSATSLFLCLLGVLIVLFFTMITALVRVFLVFLCFVLPERLRALIFVRTFFFSQEFLVSQDF